MREVIARIVDRSRFDEYKAEVGRTVLCGYARIGGRAVGIVANQKTNQTQTVAMGPAAGTSRIEVGGVIYTESAQKAARFIRSEEHTSELQSPCNLVCRLLLEKKKARHARR